MAVQFRFGSPVDRSSHSKASRSRSGPRPRPSPPRQASATFPLSGCYFPSGRAPKNGLIGGGYVVVTTRSRHLLPPSLCSKPIYASVARTSSRYSSSPLFPTGEVPPNLSLFPFFLLRVVFFGSTRFRLPPTHTFRGCRFPLDDRDVFYLQETRYILHCCRDFFLTGPSP